MSCHRLSSIVLAQLEPIGRERLPARTVDTTANRSDEDSCGIGAALLVDLAQKVGEISGCVYAAWALDDEPNPLKSKILGNMVADKVYSLLAKVVGGYVAGRVAESVGKEFGEWVGGILGGAAGQAFAEGGFDFREFGQSLVEGVGTMGFDAIGKKNPFIGLAMGVATGAGFYAGVVEYAADDVNNWGRPEEWDAREWWHEK